MANLLPFSAFSPSANTDLVLYDTNMAIALVGPTDDPRLLEARRFTATLTENMVAIVTSVKAHEEFRIVGATETIAHSRAKQKQVLSKNPAAINGAIDWAHDVEQALANLPTYFPEPVGEINKDLVEKATNLMSRYGLQWGDAVHLAIAYEEGINCIATLDGDFSRVSDSGILIFTDTVNYQKVTRQQASSGC